MDTTKKPIRHLSLCSGYEGIGIGLRRVFPTLRDIAYVEIEAYAVANLVAKMEANELHPAPVFTNLKTFPFRKFRGCLDILSGGFPCQPFSVSNSRSRKSTEDPRHLFPFILEGIKECRPSVIFLENVEGILSCKTRDGEPVLKYVLRSLEGVGYRATAGIFSASEVGAPHQRKRVFILAHAEHNGQSAVKVRGGTKEASKGFAEGQDETSNLEGTGEPQSSADIQGGKSDNLADTNDKGLERRDSRSVCERPFQLPARQGSSQVEQWVARPDQPQHGWEAPRTISKSELGGTVDGTEERVDSLSYRVDRLRLVGNGVCPAQAERAFRVLYSRL